MVNEQMSADYLACALEAADELLEDRFVAISADPRIGIVLTELTTLLLGGISGLTRDGLEGHKATLNMLARHHTVEPEVRRLDSVTIACLQSLSDVVDRLWESLPANPE